MGQSLKSPALVQAHQMHRAPHPTPAKYYFYIIEKRERLVDQLHQAHRNKTTKTATISQPVSVRYSRQGRQRKTRVPPTNKPDVEINNKIIWKAQTIATRLERSLVWAHTKKANSPPLLHKVLVHSYTLVRPYKHMKVFVLAYGSASGSGKSHPNGECPRLERTEG